MLPANDATSMQLQNNKRKTTLNLEHIVLKLKQSKKPDRLPLLPNQQINDNDSDRYHEDEKDEEDYVLSPVFPRDISEKQKIFLSEKSSFMTQLEQKDNLCLMMEESELHRRRHHENNNKGQNRQRISTLTSSHESSREGSVTSNSEDERDLSSSEQSTFRTESQKQKLDELNRGDFQLAKLLEEEKILASSGDSEVAANVDKIDETKCHKCNKRFYRRSQLIRHLSNHVVHECLQCSAVFYCVKKYKKHMSTHETYPCDFCSEEFFDASAWYKHRAKHTMMDCSCCDMIFYNKTALAKHKFEHSEYICPLCRFASKNLHHWISHRNYHGRCSLLQPIIACRECKLTFASQEVFLKHTCSKHNLSKISPPILPPVPPTGPPSHHVAQKQYERRPVPASSVVHTKNIHRSTKSFFKDHLYRQQHQHAPTPKSKISRPEPFYLAGRRATKDRLSGPRAARYFPYFPSKPFKRVMNKKEIKELIGIDQTLTCSS